MAAAAPLFGRSVVLSRWSFGARLAAARQTTPASRSVARSSSSMPISASTASVSAPTVHRAACRTLPGVPLSFGTIPGALAEVRVVVDVGGRVHGRADHAGLVDDLVELLGGVAARPLANDLVEQVLVLPAGVVG